MARIKFHSSIDTVSGSIQGLTFSKFRDTHIMRSKPIPTIVDNTLTSFLRTNMQLIVAAYQALTDAQYNAWLTQMATYIYPGIPQAQWPMNVFNFFVQHNILRLQSSLSINSSISLGATTVAVGQSFTFTNHISDLISHKVLTQDSDVSCRLALSYWRPKAYQCNQLKTKFITNIDWNSVNNHIGYYYWNSENLPTTVDAYLKWQCLQFNITKPSLPYYTSGVALIEYI
jgi:hypothetical protein